MLRSAKGGALAQCWLASMTTPTCSGSITPSRTHIGVLPTFTKTLKTLTNKWCSPPRQPPDPLPTGPPIHPGTRHALCEQAAPGNQRSFLLVMQGTMLEGGSGSRKASQVRLHRPPCAPE
jgi:hypothetical protein